MHCIGTLLACDICISILAKLHAMTDDNSIASEFAHYCLEQERKKTDRKEKGKDDESIIEVQSTGTTVRKVPVRYIHLLRAKINAVNCEVDTTIKASTQGIAYHDHKSRERLLKS